MKVKDTVQLIYATLPAKIENFCNEYKHFETRMQWIKKSGNFPSFQYTGMGQFEEVIVWAEETFGNDWLWDWETFYFKYEKDRTVFALRWS